MTSYLPGLEPDPGDSDRDSWATPPALYRDLDADAGGFGCDVCAEAWSAKCPVFFTKADDALSRSWPRFGGPGTTCFENPPFSQLEEWTRKAAMERAAGSRIYLLMPAHRNEQDWFQDWVIGHAREVRAIRGRVAYVPPVGIKSSTPGFGSQVAIYDPRDRFPVLTAIDGFPRLSPKSPPILAPTITAPVCVDCNVAGGEGLVYSAVVDGSIHPACLKTLTEFLQTTGHPPEKWAALVKAARA